MGCKICHFEIPVDNVEKAKTFYEKLFGWKIERMPMGDEKEYFFIDTGDDLKGGLMKKIMPEHVPVNYILVPNVDEDANKCQSLGGKVVMGKTAVPTMGYFVVCLDPSGNCIGLWEADNRAC